MCVICKKRVGTQTAHFFGKGAHPYTRWDIKNSLWSCYRCHLIDFHKNGDTEHAREILIQRYGLMEFLKLKEEAHSSKTHSLLDLDALVTDLSLRLE